MAEEGTKDKAWDKEVLGLYMPGSKVLAHLPPALDPDAHVVLSCR